MLIQPLGMIIQPLGMIIQPLGMVIQPLGMVIQPLGMIIQPLGMIIPGNKVSLDLSTYLGILPAPYPGFQSPPGFIDFRIGILT